MPALKFTKTQITLDSGAGGRSPSPFKALSAVALSVSLACGLSVQAATAPANIAVSATVMATCTNTTPYNVGLSSGMAPAATVTTRRMTGGVGVFLGYTLFSDTGRTTNWGSTIGTDTVVGTGSGAGQVLTIYGRVAAGQFPAPGAYTDTIIATVIY